MPALDDDRRRFLALLTAEPVTHFDDESLATPLPRWPGELPTLGRADRPTTPGRSVPAEPPADRATLPPWWLCNASWRFDESSPHDLLPYLHYCDEQGRMRLWWPDDEREAAEMLRFYSATRTFARPKIDPTSIFPLPRGAAERSFLAHIATHLDDDAPRLIYADWLDEQRDPRGEFIRVQCERAKLPPGDPQDEPLRRREHELFLQHRDEWLAPLAAIGIWPSSGTTDQGDVFFRRGLIDLVWILTADVLPAHADRLWDAAPALEHLVLSGPIDLPTVLADPRWNQLTSLNCSTATGFHYPGGDFMALTDAANLRHQFTPAEISAIIDSPHLENLRSLTLVGELDYVYETLFRSPFLGRLEELRLPSTEMESPTVEALTSCPHLASLAHLAVEGVSWLTDDDAALFAQSLYLRRLRSLSLAGCRDLSPEGLARLATGDWPRLTELNLRGCRFGDAGARAIARADRWPSLRRLDLAETGLSDEGAASLIDSPSLSALTSLTVSRSALSASLIAALAERFGAALRLD
ncbi:MAG TPA: TIGR02996 domain-containing protein [Pirellulales bacterium]